MHKEQIYIPQNIKQQLNQEKTNMNWENIFPTLFDANKQFVLTSPKDDYGIYLGSNLDTIWNCLASNKDAIKLFCMEYNHDFPCIKLKFYKNAKNLLYTMIVFYKSGEDPSTTKGKIHNFKQIF